MTKSERRRTSGVRFITAELKKLAVHKEATIRERIEVLKLLGVIGRIWRFPNLIPIIGAASPNGPDNPDLSKIDPELAELLGVKNSFGGQNV